MKKAYPVFIVQHQKDYLVYIPDLDIYTEGKDTVDAIYMARDAIGLAGITREDMNQSIPSPSSLSEAKKTAESNREIFDYSTGILTLVDVDFAEYRRKLDNRSVKKNCTIPYWLNAAAEREGINFSRVLQDALIKVLHIQS